MIQSQIKFMSFKMFNSSGPYFIVCFLFCFLRGVDTKPKTTRVICDAI